MPASFEIAELPPLLEDGLRAARLLIELVTLFGSVGFAMEDFSALRYVRGHVERTGLYGVLDMIADPDDARDLFGMLQRADTARNAA